MLRGYNGLKIGQAAIEFVILVGIVFFAFLVFLGIILHNLQDLNRREDVESLESISLTVQNELNLATSVQDGYYREFTLPEKLNGKDYTIQQSENFIYFELGKYSTSKRIPKISDISNNIIKGVNTINKSEGVIHVNQG